jgi:glycosyltransferase involved in cell wall biosynthesis
MGRKGRQRVMKHFGWDRVAEGVLEVYREMAAERTKEENMEGIRLPM